MNKITKIRSRLAGLKLDALFLSNQYNVSYLTGFTGLSPNEREGFLFVTQKTAYLLTFPTYFGLFKKGGDGFVALNITRNIRLSDHLSKISKKEDLNRIGFEKDNLTFAEFESLKTKISATLSPTQNVVEEERVIKDITEITKIKKAAKITDTAFEFIKKKIKRGVAEKELAIELEFFLKKTAGDAAFPPIVAFDKNAAIPHYFPSHNTQLTTHNLILLDFGAKVDGYCSDMTRVVFFGSPNKNRVKIYNTVLKAQELALKRIKSGLSTSTVDKVARDFIKSSGFPQYPHGLGHGVGLAIHEAPRLKSESTEVLREKMVVTVEPGIYLEGLCGVRIEDLVVLTKDGCEILSKSAKELTIL